jgi:hypothetical protein
MADGTDWRKRSALLAFWIDEVMIPRGIVKLENRMY